MEGGTKATADQIERELGELLDQETFDPPEEFVRDALITDESVYDEAARDPEAWWAKQAEALDWFEPWDQVLDESEAPFYKWFTGGKLNASHNALDRHVDAGRGDRVAYHWRGEEGEERDVTYAELLRDVKRLANVLKDRGVEPGDVVGIFLPMIPEVAVAMLACARIGAPHNVVFGGFSPESVKERMEFSEAKALITVDCARRKGKVGRHQARGGRLPRRRALDRDRGRRAQHGRRRGHARGARRLLRRGDRGGLGGLPGRAARRRAPAVRALHLRLHRQAQGHPPHHRRLPDGRGLDQRSTCST